MTSNLLIWVKVNNIQVAFMKPSIQNEIADLIRLLRTGNQSTALQKFKSLYKKHPNNIDILKSGYSLYSAQGKESEGLQFVEKIFFLNPNNFQQCFALVDKLLSYSLESRAEKVLLTFLKNSSTHRAEALLKLSKILKSQFEFKQAVKYVEQALEEESQLRSELLLELAILRCELKQEWRAIVILQQLLQLEPNHPIAKFNLATLLQAAGQFSQAENLYIEVFDSTSNIEALVRAAFSKKVTSEEDIIYLKLCEELENNRTAYEQECLYYAKGKMQEDMSSYKESFDSYKVANELNRKRIGNFNIDQYTNNVEKLKSVFVKPTKQKQSFSASKHPVFIVGNFRSGSTLVEQILNAHSQVRGLGELDYFMKAVGWSDLKLPSQDGCFKDIGKGYAKLVSEMDFSEPYFIDKRPENLWYVGHIKSFFPNAKFIFTQRNLIDNALSVYFNQLNDLSTYSTSPQDFYKYDQLLKDLYHHWHSLYPDDLITVYYEELVKEPKKIVSILLAFLQLEWEDSCLSFSETESFIRTASVNQARQHIYQSSVNKYLRFVDYLSETDKRTFKLL